MTSPTFISPQLATSITMPPEGNNYCHEIKYDGFRMMAYVEDCSVKIFTRNGNNWTSKFPHLVKSLSKLKIKNAIFDGEFIALNKKSYPDFQLLQNKIHKNDDANIFYYIFDILHINGNNLTKKPLRERKKILEQILVEEQGPILISDYIIGNGPKIFEKVYQLGLEGIISKKLDAPYVPGRNKNWLKCKCYREEEFILVGYLSSQGRVSSFLLGNKKNKRLVYCGRVSADFINIDAQELFHIVKKIISSKPSSSSFPLLKKATWLMPIIQVKVRYTERTQNGYLRQATFIGLGIR